MTIRKLFVWATLTALLPCLVHGQGAAPKGSLNITAEQPELRSDGKGNMVIEFNINPGGIRLTPDEQLVVVPVIKEPGGKSRMLPRVIVNGRRRSKVEKRMERISRSGGDRDTIYKVIRAGTKGGVDKNRYRASIDHQPWMEKAGLYLQSEFCGCGGNGQEFAERLVLPSMKEGAYPAASAQEKGDCPATASGAPYEGVQIGGHCVLPYVTFFEPTREIVKRRSEEGSAYITYLPGSATISPTLANNHGELEKIAKSLHLAGKDSRGDLAVTGISIASYSSPEGSWDANLELSERRAAALEEYILTHFNLPAECSVTAEGKGEDWDKLLELVEEDPHVEAKAEAVRIMQGTDVFSGREKQLMDLAGGRTYRYLMQRHFPALRRSDYRIEYTVPEFDLSYGRDMLEHRPGMLSHYELYTIAFTGYPMGSAMFNKVFRTARMLFPTDRVSQFNLGTVCLLEGKADEAAELLEAFRTDPLAWNNLGVLYMMQGRFEEAHAYLNRAVGSGNREAVENLKILKRLWNPSGKK